MSTTKKNVDIVLGDVSATDSELELKDAKTRITMMIDLDVVKGFKELAQKSGAKYQTLMNQKLREALVKESETESLFERVKKLERFVFSKPSKKRAG